MMITIVVESLVGLAFKFSIVMMAPISRIKCNSEKDESIKPSCLVPLLRSIGFQPENCYGLQSL